MLALADVAVTVSNAQETGRWWQEKVGFAVHTVGEPGGHALMVAPPGERFLIHLCEGFEPVDGGNTGIAFMTDEIESVVRRMEQGGVKFEERLRKEEWGAMAKFSDPDGNIFWLLGAPAEFIRQETSRRAAEVPLEGPRAARGRPKSRK